MYKCNYSLETLSSVILSPRNQQVFYSDAKEEAKIIYPFYQYGTYEAYSKEADYYIPGSSIKGAIRHGILEEESNRNAPQLMVDDIQLKEVKDKIVPRNLYKVQILKKEKEKIVFDVFFQNIEVEMLVNGVKCNGELYYSNCNIEQLFEQLSEYTRKKIEQMEKQLENIFKKREEKDIKYDCEEAINQVLKNLNKVKERKNIMLLGGYKGLYHSMLISQEVREEEKSKSGIYIDEKTHLPHGLIEVHIL